MSSNAVGTSHAPPPDPARADQEERGRSPHAAHHHTLLPRLLTSLVRRHRVASFHLTLSSGRGSQLGRSTSLPRCPRPASSSPPGSSCSRANPTPTSEGGGRHSRAPSAGCSARVWSPTASRRERAARRGRSRSRAKGTRLVRPCIRHSALCVLLMLTYALTTEHRLYRLTMPRLAAACTESLTPFLSLLPCASHAGLTSLLNPHRLFDGEWTLIGINFAKEEAEETAKIELEVGSVQDPVRRDRLTGQMGRRGASTPDSSRLPIPTLTAMCRPQSSPSTASSTARSQMPAPSRMPRRSSSSSPRTRSARSRSSPTAHACYRLSRGGTSPSGTCSRVRVALDHPVAAHECRTNSVDSQLSSRLRWMSG